MKKIFAIALVAVFVLGMAVSAFAAHLEVTGDGAGIKANGSYRLRAISLNNTEDQSDDASDHIQYYNQRLRLQFTFIVGDDVSVVTRGDIAEGIWDGKSQTQANDYDVDHAYLVLNKFGLTFNIGLQPANWGNKFWSWANTAERIKVYKNMDGTIIGAFLQKDNEDYLDAVPDYKGDRDTYAAFVSVPAMDGKTSLIYVNIQQREGDIDGTVIDLAHTSKFGAIGLAFEFVTMSGDLLVTPTDEEKPTGFFVMVNMDIADGMNVALGYAATQNGFIADDDFGPTLLFGPSANATGIMQVGEMANYNNNYSGAEDDTSSAVVVAFKMAVGDDMNIGANAAMATLSKEDDIDLTEIDLWMDYNLATNTKFWAGYAYGMPKFGDSVLFPNDDPITSAAFQIVTSF